MLIIKVEGNMSIDKALKLYKSKVIKTKQSSELSNRREYVKKSVKRRNQVNKAKYVEKKFKSEN